MSVSPGFVLHGGNAEFANKQKELFDRLCVAEKNHNKDKNNTKNPERGEKRSTPSPKNYGMKKFRGKESIFKRPQAPCPKNRIRVIPDYHRNPQKWTKYSLDDCTDVTDKSNSQAAFAFLNELKARGKPKENEDELMEVDEVSTSLTTSTKRNKEAAIIQFKKKSISNDDSDTVDHDRANKPIFRSSKVIMPECVIGEKPKKITEKKITVQDTNITKAVKLGHLNEEEDEEET